MLAALASGSTIDQVAAVAHVGERTVRRRLADPAFRAQVKAEQAKVIEGAVTALGAASAHAVTTLVALLDAPTPPAVRHMAARSVLELGPKLRADFDYEVRLNAIENALATMGHRP